MQEAFNAFFRPENVRSFILDILHENRTPFICKLAQFRGQEAYATAAEMKQLLEDYLKGVYKVTRYFDAQEIKTFGDYLAKDPCVPMLAMDYLSMYLDGRYPTAVMYELCYSMIEPYQNKKPIYGENN